jgi:hypothetical protein
VSASLERIWAAFVERLAAYWNGGPLGKAALIVIGLGLVVALFRAADKQQGKRAGAAECPACGGSGKIYRTDHVRDPWAYGALTPVVRKSTCSMCDGSGRYRAR